MFLRLFGQYYCNDSSNDVLSSTVKGCVIIMLLAFVNVSLALTNIAGGNFIMDLN